MRKTICARSYTRQLAEAVTDIQLWVNYFEISFRDFLTINEYVALGRRSTRGTQLVRRKSQTVCSQAKWHNMPIMFVQIWS
ncbi:hypothetical protein JZ00_02540 [Pseudomonas frederiksbergensis]|uniref:Uncharacterized protein n=1 Tax=Pseudomonas frederiksbergensis TaxID=104087 RepID=A0A0B1ZBG0_9PSED|nr:hypothetical protein JZ00_02540 [Pseudomonas frederiksbergensis]